MTAITFTQSTNSNGQVVLALSSSDLPPGTFSFSLNLTYTGSSVRYSSANFAGSSSTSISASAAGSNGTISIQGSIAPGTGSQFATLLFDATGTGVFNADVQAFAINGVRPTFTDPAAFSYTIAGLSETVALAQGGTASGSFKPLDMLFSTSLTSAKAPEHGTVGFGDVFSGAKWTYTPTANFYGSDTFTIRASDGFSTREKTIEVNISPVGTSSNDIFKGTKGKLAIDGHEGIDAIQYKGSRGGFTVSGKDGAFTVTDASGAEGTYTLTNVERLFFADEAVALDITGNAGQAYRLYQAAFNRVPDKGGLGFWISGLDKGASLLSVADGFVHSNEFREAYGANPTNTELVTRMYQNILHREPEAAGLKFWVAALDSGTSRAEVLANVSESLENQEGLIGIIGNGFAYTPFL